MSGEAISDAVCLAFDMPDVIVVIHNFTLYQEHWMIIYIANISGLILSQYRAITIDDDWLNRPRSVVITHLLHVLDSNEFQLQDIPLHLSMLE